jgi:hypothetical protein
LLVFCAFLGGWLSRISWERRASLGSMGAFLEWLSYSILIGVPLFFIVGIIVRGSDVLFNIELRLREIRDKMN